MAVQAVCRELVSVRKSLIHRENTGKYRESDISSGAGCSAEAQSGVLTGEFPAFGNREIFAGEQGTSAIAIDLPTRGDAQRPRATLPRL